MKSPDEESIWLLVLAFIAIMLGWFFVIAWASNAFAHDSWISKHGYRNNLGEWCCGDYDCKSYSSIKSTPRGWIIPPTPGQPNINWDKKSDEFIPFDEAFPIAPPEGDVVVCRRPDGSRRCVFGLKPGL